MTFFNRRNLLVGGFVGGVSSLVLAAGESPLEAAAARHNAQVIWVNAGTPLYQVASTLVRDTDKSAVGDGTINKSELIRTQLCDDVFETYRVKIKSTNNEIAKLTATVADEVSGYEDLARAMRLDNVMVRLSDGTTCTDNPAYITVLQPDTIIGDGFAGMRAASGLVPIVVPNTYLPAVASPGDTDADADMFEDDDDCFNNETTEEDSHVEFKEEEDDVDDDKMG